MGEAVDARGQEEVDRFVAVVLRDLQELSYQEIADRLGLPRPGLASHVDRIVDDLESPEWNISAVGPTKRGLADDLRQREGGERLEEGREAGDQRRFHRCRIAAEIVAGDNLSLDAKLVNKGAKPEPQRCSTFLIESSYSTGDTLSGMLRNGRDSIGMKSTTKINFSFGSRMTSELSEWLRPT